jgi:protoheme IX farnesyltransferase
MINYYLLMKPGIIFGNLITVAAGFLLASKGRFDFALFVSVVLGIGLVIASACVFNNYIDRVVDRKMERTKNRPLATGLIPVPKAIIFGVLLGFIGFAVLYHFTNLLTVWVAAGGYFVYVVFYSIWKCHTIYSTAIGSIAGAAPPVVGYCAVSNQFDTGVLILFAMLILWQMPHFFSIALYRFEDYAAADIPVLPVKKGMFRTKVHMTLYIVGFIIAATLLTYLGYTGYLYLLVVLTLSLYWLAYCLKGFRISDDHTWGRGMFRLSLILIMAISFVIPFDTV